MGFRLPSYQPDGHNQCYWGQKDEPCWGPVDWRDEFYDDETGDVEEISSCEAHDGCWSVITPWKYQPSPYAQDQGVVPVEDEV